VNDIIPESNLIEDLKGNYILGDKGYDSKKLVEEISRQVQLQ
jgi:hypothetical protein